MDNAFIAQLLRWDNRSPRPWQCPINWLLALLRVDAQLAPRAFRWDMANVEARMTGYFRKQGGAASA